MEGRGPGQPPAPAPATDAARLRALAVQLDDLLPFAGAATVVLASLALIVALFLPWYDIPTALIDDDWAGSPNAWESFRYSDVYLTCIAAIGIGATALATVFRFRAPFAVAGLAGWVGVAIVLYSYYRPRGFGGPFAAPDLGYFLAICASGAITGGSLMAMMGRRNGTPPA